MNNNLIGQIFTGLIVDENEKAYFVQKEGTTFSLSKEEGEHSLGESIKGFAFLDILHKGALTTNIPDVRINHFGWGTVTKVRRDLGAFVDINLPNKDVLISLDDLPLLKEGWPKVNDRLYISLVVDEKGRLWGKLADEEIFRTIARPVAQDMQNKNMSGTVFRLKKIGTYLFTDDFYLGFVHPSERFNEPRLGEKVSARVIGLSKAGFLNMSLVPRVHEMINDDALLILTLLEKSSEKKIPYTDNSTPEIIKTTFGISKGQFKRAIGRLLKEKKIKQENGYTVLLSGE